MRIAVYPGSFDPLHRGHLAIMEYLTADRDFDMAYLVISPQSPFKDPSKADSAERRYRDAVAAVALHPDLKVRVEDIELGMAAPHYTIRTLDALKCREPGNEFTLVMGADNLAGIRGWKEYVRILCEYGIAVYPRKPYDAAALRESLCREIPEARIEILDAGTVDISSTRIREAMAAGEDMSAWLMDGGSK